MRNVILILVFITFVGNNNNLFITFYLKAPFLVKGKLVIAAKDAVEPLEATERLYLLFGSKMTNIVNLNQLRGKVEINTPKEALAFVRLKTSPKTFYTFKPPECWEWELEVISPDLVDEDFVFGDKRKAEALKKCHSGYYGITPKSRLAEFGIGTAKVRETKQGYEIERVIIVKDFKKKLVRVFKVIEFVERDGYYIRKRKIPIDTPAIRSYFKFAFPTFE